MQTAMFHARILFTAVLASLSSSIIGARWIPSMAPPCDFPAIYNFGDSNSDTGGTSAAFWPLPAPYGITHFRRPSGRSSDGRLIIDFIAENLKLPYLSPYLDSLGTDFRHGANFATAGSTIRRQNESIFENHISPFSLDIQTVQFDQFKARTSELYRQAAKPMNRSKLPKPEDFPRALYTFDIGQNDLAVGFREVSMPQLRAAIPDMVKQLSEAVTHLYLQGARAFWIHNTGPVGCLPSTHLYFTSPKRGFFDKYGCVRSQNAIAVEFNKQLKARVTTLRAELPHASIIYVDIYSAKYQLISNPKSYGFSEAMKICCGRHENNVNVWCGQRQTVNGTRMFGSACDSPATHISWDGVHYTEAANNWIANRIINGSFSDPPMSIAHACLKPY